MWFGVWKKRTYDNFELQLFSLTASSPALPNTTIYRSDTTRVRPRDAERWRQRQRQRLGMRQDEEKQAWETYDISRAYSMFFLKLYRFFFAYFFLATNYDNDNEDVAVATRDVKQQRDTASTRDTEEENGPERLLLLGPIVCFLFFVLFFFFLLLTFFLATEYNNEDTSSVTALRRYTRRWW